MDRGYYYLSTVLDSFFRYIFAWKLITGMSHMNIQDILNMAIASTGVKQVTVKHCPCVLSDNSLVYPSDDLADYLQTQGIQYTRGASRRIIP